jgi:DNA-binding NarL/FixJ family response regulator
MFVTTPHHVIIAHPQRMFVETLRSAVESTGMPVVRVATSFTGLIEALRFSPEAVCLTAWEFPDGALQDAMSDILSVAREAKIVVLSSSGDAAVLSAALASGVQGFIHTSRGLDVLLDALVRLQNGEIVIEASLTRPCAAHTDDSRRVRELASYLTAREYECLTLIVTGLDTAAMARRLGVSRTTIRSHVQAMLIKLGVHSRLEAAALAVEHRLLGEAMGLAAGI